MKVLLCHYKMMKCKIIQKKIQIHMSDLNCFCYSEVIAISIWSICFWIFFSMDIENIPLSISLCLCPFLSPSIYVTSEENIVFIFFYLFLPRTYGEHFL